MTTSWTVDEWHGCYRRGWGTILPKAAYQHPAKVSFSLAERIYRHLVDAGQLNRGDRVLDPFAGIGGFGFHALGHGLHYLGIEVEPRFAEIGAACIEHWHAAFGSSLARWGTAEILVGDSRRLLAGPLAAPAAIVSSPPYSADSKRDHTKDSRDDRRGHTQGRGSFRGQYGRAIGQLAAMAEGDFAAVVASPPFRHQTGGTRITCTTGPLSDVNLFARHAATNSAAAGYGHADGQLANLPEGAIADSDENATFWAGARQVLAGCYGLLRPGGVAVWVVKDFVRNHARVPFADQWRHMAESVGFVTCHVHRALLTQDHGASLTLDGGRVHHRTKRASFFRILAERKGAPAIDWEVVLCHQKPGEAS